MFHQKKEKKWVWIWKGTYVTPYDLFDSTAFGFCKFSNETPCRLYELKMYRFANFLWQVLPFTIVRKTVDKVKKKMRYVKSKYKKKRILQIFFTITWLDPSLWICSTYKLRVKLFRRRAKDDLLHAKKVTKKVKYTSRRREKLLLSDWYVIDFVETKKSGKLPILWVVLIFVKNDFRK